MKIDLHMHSAASDGLLSPAELVRYCATEKKIDVMALTDHDTVSGIAAAREEAEKHSMRFISGIELSVNWASTCIHIVGLNVDPNDKPLVALTQSLSEKRAQRAYAMAERFAKLGVHGIYDVALKHAINKENISRSHFARALLEMQVIANEQEAFDRFIGVNSPCYVPVDWPSLAEGIGYIHTAGGLTVLAHPGRYRLEQEWQREALVESFKKANGDALEVVSGSQSADYTQQGTYWVKKYNLLASVGSDFHRHQGGRPEPGEAGNLPPGLPCVLDRLS